MSGDELKIPLRISTDQIAADLASVDREIGRLQERMVAAFNRSPAVRRGRVARAGSVEDVGPNREYWTPEVRSLEGRLNKRLQQIERAAQRGETRPPLTPFQAHQQAAQARLAQLERPTRPIEITAKAEFFDKMRQSLLRGGTNAAALSAAQTGIPGAAGLARTLMGLAAENPLLAGLLGGGLAAGGGALFLNQQQTQFQRQQAALGSALVGGPAFGSTRTLLGLAINAAGQGIDTWPAQAQQTALSLASAGVPSSQLLGNLSNTLMLSQPNALNPKDVAPLVGALGTAGGMSAADINRTLQDVVNVSGDAGVSLQELLGGMKSLSSGAIGAAKDVLSLAAVQHIVGATSGINAGALMQGVMGATGGAALQAAGMLGMTPQAFMTAQGSKGGMAQIWDRIAAFTRRLPSGAAGTMVAEQLLSSSGLLNMQGLSATKQSDLIHTLRTQGPQAAEQLAASYTAQTAKQAVSQQQSYINAATAADTLTSSLDQAGIAVTTWWTALINGPPATTTPLGAGTQPLPGQAALSPARLQNALRYGLAVPNIAGSQNMATPSVVAAYARASKATGVPLAVLLAQGSQESGFQIRAPGGGLGQFTPGTIQTLATSAADNRLVPGLNKFFGSFKGGGDTLANQATAQALYDELLHKLHPGAWSSALAAYNGSGPAAQAYGTGVYAAAQAVSHQLAITVTVKDQGGQPLARTVNHQRVVTGAAHHGHPPPQPPAPGAIRNAPTGPRR